MTRLFALVPSQWASRDVCEIFSFTIKDPRAGFQEFLPEHMVELRRREILFRRLRVFTYDQCVNNYHDLSCSDCFQEHGQSVFQFHLTVCDLKAIHFRF